MIREATRAEEAFVLASWKRGFRDSCPELPGEYYWRWQDERIQRVLSRGALVLVAVDAEYPQTAYGWVCAERVGDAAVVHWVYVRASFRKHGIAGALLGDALARLGDDAERLVHSHRHHVRFDGTAARMGFEYVPLDRLEKAERAA